MYKTTYVYKIANADDVIKHALKFVESDDQLRFSHDILAEFCIDEEKLAVTRDGRLEKLIKLICSTKTLTDSKTRQPQNLVEII